MELTRCEAFSVNYFFTEKLAHWEAADSGWMGFFASRVVVLVVSPFTAILDLLIHSVLGAVKLMGGIVLGPINFIATHCGCGGWKCCENLLPESLTHIFIVFKTAVFIPVVCFTGLFSPKLAQENADIRNILRAETKKEEEKTEEKISTNPFDERNLTKNSDY